MTRMLTDAEACQIFVMYAGGVSRTEIAATFDVPIHRIFDRRLEARGRGKLAHPKLAHLPIRQGCGGGPRAIVDPTPAEIESRAAAIRAQRGTTSRDMGPP